MVEVAGRSEGKKLLSTVLVWLRNNLVGDCVDSSKIFLIVASISDMNFIVFFLNRSRSRSPPTRRSRSRSRERRRSRSRERRSRSRSRERRRSRERGERDGRHGRY